MRKHLEVINHCDAITYVEEIVEKNEPLSEWQIKNLHRLVLKEINDEYVYRDQQVVISGATHTPPAPYLLKQKMEQLMDWYKEETEELQPITHGAMLHAFCSGPFLH
ncbi:Fic family protein [Virgibacillus doumboii]|uniref:Fic family protein n=1 Tax=Virgibacillus doumboii TaxID=2697503 RepID=UPI0031B571F3